MRNYVRERKMPNSHLNIAKMPAISQVLPLFFHEKTKRATELFEKLIISPLKSIFVSNFTTCFCLVLTFGRRTDHVSLGTKSYNLSTRYEENCRATAPFEPS